MRKVMVAIMLSGLALSPAFAQTQTPAGQTKSMADCESNFKAADKDGDGTLTKEEMSSTPNVVPTSVSSQDSVTMQQFITACTAGAPKGG